MQPFFYAFYVKSWITFVCISCFKLAKNTFKAIGKRGRKMGYRRRLMFITILVTLIICAGMVAQFHFGNIQTAEAASLYWG